MFTEYRFPHFHVMHSMRYTSGMSKETITFILGALILLTQFLGLPREYKDWFFIIVGIVLMYIGYTLRRRAFLKSIEHSIGERRGDAFAESELTHKNTPPHKDSTYVV